MRLIDADKLDKMLLNDGVSSCLVYAFNGKNPKNKKYTIGQFRGYLAKAPTVDAQIVVYCKDCKYYQYKPLNYICTRDPTSVLSARRGHDYCSFAERREENEAD